MEITKSNFKELLPLIKDAVMECDFLAIDTELTGLSTQNSEHAFDSMEERYSKLREAAGKFLIIQYGLSCFKYHSKQNKYSHKDFNFYVFPRPYCRQAPDYSFMCQASSLHYLASQGFDFNKLLNEGISFLMPSQEEKLKEQLKDKHDQQLQSFEEAAAKNGAQNSSDKKLFNVPEEHKEFVKDIHQQVETLIYSDTENSLKLPPCNAYLRRLIYTTVLQKHPTGLDLSTSADENNQYYITVVKATEDEKRNALHLRQTSDINELEDAVGFRKVLEFITESKKLVIGHNMLLDILHTVHQFYYPLPEGLQDFKEITRCIFPCLIDTKNLASASRFKDNINRTSLGGLLSEVRSKMSYPLIEPTDGFKGYELEVEKFHEAGYDAFVTGYCYIALTSQLATDKKFLSPESEILRPFINRIFIMKHFDISSINLQGPDPEPCRDNVFYITFPKEWKTDDLLSLFFQYGNIYISWLNETSALIALKNPEQKINVHNTLLKNLNCVYRVKTFADYKKMMAIKKASLSWDSRSRSLNQSDDLPPAKRRSSSGSTENSFTNRSIDPIPEEEEEEEQMAEDDKAEDDIVSTSHEANSVTLKRSRVSSSSEPKTKKTKVACDEEFSEVTSTEKLFEEPNEW